MNDDEFDLRLRQAVRPLVTEIVPRSVALDAQDMDGATWRRTAFGAGLPVAIAIVLVAAFAGAFSLSRGAGVIGPGTFPSPAVDTVAHGTKIATPDGEVFVRTSADGARLELVLEKDAATPIVLVSIDERMPTGNVSSISVHLVDCPPSTGLAQQYYVLGQSTDSGTVVLHGLAGAAAEMAGGRYLIAITSPSIPPDRWTFDVRGTGSGGGALGSSFLSLPTYGQRSAAGCFFNAP